MKGNFLDYNINQIIHFFYIYRMPAPQEDVVENEPPKTELQELQLKAQQQTDEVSLSVILSTKRNNLHNLSTFIVTRINSSYVGVMWRGEKSL